MRTLRRWGIIVALVLTLAVFPFSVVDIKAQSCCDPTQTTSFVNWWADIYYSDPYGCGYCWGLWIQVTIVDGCGNVVASTLNFFDQGCVQAC